MRETVIVDGKIVVRELCEVCASEEGIHPGATASALVGKASAAHAAKLAMARRQAKRRQGQPVCGTCGGTFATFKETRLLGCPDCYETLERPLGVVLARAHDGATHHVGKVPKRLLAKSKAEGRPERLLGDQQRQKKHIEWLERLLSQALAAENYERAARLKREIDQARALGGLDPLDPHQTEGDA